MEKIKVWVKTELGLKGSEQIEVDPTETIGTLKKRIATKWAFEPKNTVLIHNNEVLDESQSIKNYGIKENETIHVTPKHVPGAGHHNSSHGGNFPRTFSQRISKESEMIRLQELPIKPITPRRWIMIVSARKGKWKDKKYKVQFELSDRYPFKCPKVKFLSKNMVPPHPNIFPRTGYICFYMFKMRGWRPYFSLISSYYAILWLLENPNYEDFLANPNFQNFYRAITVNNRLWRSR